MQQKPRRRWIYGLAAVLIVGLVMGFWFQEFVGWGLYLLNGGKLAFGPSYDYHGDWGYLESRPGCRAETGLTLELSHPCLGDGSGSRFLLDVTLGHTVYRGPFRRELTLAPGDICRDELSNCSPIVRIADLKEGRWHGWSNKEAYSLDGAQRVSLRLKVLSLGEAADEIVITVVE